jgi:hypothetical protein
MMSVEDFRVTWGGSKWRSGGLPRDIEFLPDSNQIPIRYLLICGQQIVHADPKG